MAINKNFVVKNGLEVNTNQIFADSSTGKVGIGSTQPTVVLDVQGAIAATDVVSSLLRVTGYSTLPQVTVNNDITVLGFSTLTNELNVLGISSLSNLRVVGVATFENDVNLNGNVNATGFSTFVGLTSVANLKVAGVSTFVGFSTFNDYVTIQDGLNVLGNGSTTTTLNVSGVSTLSGNVSFGSSALFGDSQMILLGSDNDLEIFHNGSNRAYIRNNDQILAIQSPVEIEFNSPTRPYARFTESFGVVLYDNNSQIRLQTLGAGVTVTGTTFTNQLNVSGVSTFLSSVGIGTTDISYLLTVGAVGASGTTLLVNGDARIGGISANGIDIRSGNTSTLIGPNVAGNASPRPVNSVAIGADALYEGDTVVGCVAIGYGVGRSNTGDYNTFIGNESGYYVTSGNNNTILGTYNGNQNGLDIRTSSNNVVLSDGSGNIRLYANSIGNVGIGTTNPTSALTVSGLTSTSQLYVTGVSTLGTVLVSSGVVTAASGIVTYYGDGQYLDLTNNSSTGIGIGTTGGVVGYGITFIDFYGAGVSTSLYNSNAGIATIYFEGGGGGGSASIGIGSTPGEAFPTGIITAGNLWYHKTLGRLFIYYQDDADAQWVDAAPFNVGIITSLTGGVSFSDGTANSPSWYFADDQTTGVFSPSNGELTFVSTGSSIFNINQSGINVTGIVTATDFDSLSDENLKENITTVNNATDIVSHLRGVRFEWKKDHKPSYGVIAQELEQVLPELVSNTDPKTVNYNGIIGVLIEAIKEQQKQIDDLIAKINDK